MNSQEYPAYGLWSLVIMNAAFVLIFAFSFFKPHTKRDWRSFGAFSAFIVALFTEMYGFPLTIYLLSGWLINRYPGINLFSHDTGHLWATIFGWKGDPHWDGAHIASEIIIVAGFVLLGTAWRVLYRAQTNRQLATTGPYTYLRHPQYVGFILIMAGFIVQWPTVVTLVMFPILLVMYIRLSRREERESLAEFGEIYQQYAAITPGFIPKFRKIEMVP
jgi:protein-S-isoprenylcysteine O-methyltransferase Ste14